MQGNTELKDLLFKRIAAIRGTVTAKEAGGLGLDLTERIVQRLAGFAAECTDCQACLQALASVLAGLGEEAQTKVSLRNYYQAVQESKMHLRKVHKLVPEEQYSGEYMSMGVALGLVFGTCLSVVSGEYWYLSLGLPIGIGIGYSIGASLDAKAKKEGRVI